MNSITLNVFVDGYGWLLSREHPVFDDFFPHRYRVGSVLGYTNTALPTILTGTHPEVHGAFGLLLEARDPSPFLCLPWLRLVPPIVGRIPHVRRRLDRLIARRLGWTGYFSSGAIPFSRLKQYDYSEKTNIFQPRAFPATSSIFDDLTRRQIPFWTFDSRKPESANLQDLSRCLAAGHIQWAFIALQAYDGLVHRYGASNTAPREKLDAYRSAIERLVRGARRAYGSVRLNLFSDHGLADVRFKLDLRDHLKRHGIQHRRDVFMILDATMARFRYLRPGVEADLRTILSAFPGTFVDAARQRKLHVRFKGDRYGDAFFVLPEGGLIFPNDICFGAPAALHGYLPESPCMDAVAFFSTPPCRIPHHLVDLRELIACKEHPEALDHHHAATWRISS